MSRIVFSVTHTDVVVGVLGATTRREFLLCMMMCFLNVLYLNAIHVVVVVVVLTLVERSGERFRDEGDAHKIIFIM